MNNLRRIGPALTFALLLIGSASVFAKSSEAGKSKFAKLDDARIHYVDYKKESGKGKTMKRSC